ncbi:MAG: hypothetical protein A3F14_01785 [Gammaproteobacteria bacterium RIFCSPHIGHO2_12_FULL_43_28]|nr:MAG: hypothetical protein A3F14_01785 [Gammaproteobacteria bacterium RIFCSPHIGHO2_12_FULL_43_28]
MNTDAKIAWKDYLILSTETFIAFYLASFSLAMYYLKRPLNWIPLGILLLALYLFVIIVCIKRLLSKLPMAGIMILAPTAPLFALLLIISLIPVLQALR